MQESRKDAIPFLVVQGNVSYCERQVDLAPPPKADIAIAK